MHFLNFKVKRFPFLSPPSLLPRTGGRIYTRQVIPPFSLRLPHSSSESTQKCIFGSSNFPFLLLYICYILVTLSPAHPAGLVALSFLSFVTEQTILQCFFLFYALYCCVNNLYHVISRKYIIINS